MSTIPTPDTTLAGLRELRLYHWDWATYQRDTARYYDALGSAFGKAAAEQRNASANRHIKFVQTLNDFFPAGDTAERDATSVGKPTEAGPDIIYPGNPHHAHTWNAVQPGDFTRCCGECGRIEAILVKPRVYPTAEAMRSAREDGAKRYGHIEAKTKAAIAAMSDEDKAKLLAGEFDDSWMPPGGVK